MRNRIQLKGSNRDFNRELMTLVIPIALQNLISATVISVDVVMLGMISQSAMSAVSLAGQITFALTLFYMGMSAGASILTAQYWGKKDTSTIQRILSIACMFSFCVSILFFLSSFFLPGTLMRLFTNDAELIRFGSRFLQMNSFSYLVMGISQMYLSVIRSMENAKLSAWISSLCLILNIFFNAICIFILFPSRPELAISAVALATVLARIVELACCVIHSITKGSIRFRLPVRDGIQRNLLKDFLKYTLPVQGNYMVWGGALTATTAIIGHVNSDLVAANSIASVVKNLAVVLCGGIATGGSVLVGKYLGQGEIEKAKHAGNKMCFYALIFGVIAGCTILFIKPLVYSIVNLNPTAQSYLDGMLYISAYYCIAKSFNSTTIAGIFTAGGDSKFGFWCDTVVMWLIILPLSYLCAFVWQVPPIFLYIVISLEEMIKLPIAFIRYRQFKWLNNITRNFA
ncbi:MATE family efflux transporter [Paenibacillus polymyxa]|uniref:MATE family efflux transporter n=1 Tax=Paenibacillus polymyxa TaxID=1406 RepID=UPI0004DA894E|nr:MATE family efflux transporter [Paenibacillus polymyxa]KEO80209.1 multidrug transporter MATE [Paenibacillus polymyxa]MCH6186318.1 MATE family efflux transporter [Paenibacillus polymyxa]WRL60685.1 MATE family efflux transporter [Paenibacillus polymyxa]